MAVWSVHLFVVLFFTGLAGCAVVVVVSWISILKDGLSKDQVE